MRERIYIPGHFRSRPKKLPDPFAAQIAEAMERREALSKLRRDIRKASNSSDFPVLDHVPVTEAPRPGLMERMMRQFWRLG